MVLRAERRAADVLGALEPVAEVVEGEEEVLRARLRPDRRPAMARRRHGLERVARREVDEVDGGAGCLGEADAAVRRLALEARVAGQAVADRVGHAVRDEVGRDHVDDRAVLGVHEDEAAVLLGLLHRPEDVVVGAEEDAGVGGEELEVRDALGDELVHLGQARVVDVAHDHVEGVVEDRVALGLRHPDVEALAQGVPLRLDREVDDRRRPAVGGGLRPALEGVLGERAAEGQLEVGVAVDPARDHVLPRGVDRLVGDQAGQRPLGSGPAFDHRCDRLTVDEDVGLEGPVRRHDEAVLDQRAHRTLLRPWPRGRRGGPG